MSTHTPTPWKPGIYDHTIAVDGRTDVIDWPVSNSIVECLDTQVMDTDGRVWGCEGTAEGNRDYILRACNAFPDLLVACIALVNWCEITDPNETRDGMEHLNDVVDQARDAIAKAEVKVQ
jgi:hypothetical protein